MENLPNWIDVLSNVGFPIVLVFYLLIRLEKSFNQLEEAIESFVNEVKKS